MIYYAIEVMAPLLLAGLGGLFAELAGVLNIALEGMMLAGAFAAIVSASLTGSITAGMLGGLMAGTVLAYLFYFVGIRMRANIFIVGLAINLLAAGSIPFLSSAMYGTKGVLRLPMVPRMPGFFVGIETGFPLLDQIFLGHSFGVYLTLPAVLLAGLVLQRTPFGLRLRSTGKNPETLRAVGLNPDRYRRAALLISGMGAGLAGSLLALRLGVYLPNVSAGRGWIALVTIYLGYKRPFGIFIAALCFALAEGVSVAAQGVLQIPGTILLGLPYILTVLAMIAYSAMRRVAPSDD